MENKKIYVIGNSHMDPIWVWRLREGRSTWINTCRSAVKILKKYPFLKFSRSSSVCYRWIEACDPALFREIRDLVDAGRWELVGGWVEQSDTIITPGESLLRQAEHGKRYFRDKFGRDVRVAYSVDSFGQNIGLPKILKESGFDYYAWMRPQQHEKQMPHIFRWKCDDPAAGDIVSFRIRHAYCTLPGCRTLDEFEQWFDLATAFREDDHQTFFFGIGDHGGGIYEKQLQWLLKLGEKHELVFSTLEEYFKIIEKLDLPVVSGEHVHHAPGCYSAVGEVKEMMADAEKNLYKAERIILQGNFHDKKQSFARLDAAWEELLFNYFHDVYPGTCTRDSYRSEIRDLCGMVNKTAVDLIEQSLCRIGGTIRTDFLKEGGVLVWNSLPHETVAKFQFDTFADPNFNGRNFNCLRDADGGEIPLQWLRAATSYGPNNAWGRATFSAPLAASAIRAFACGYTETTFPEVGFDRQRKLLEKLSFHILSDPFDTWAHGAKRLGETIGHAELRAVEEMENGPVVSRLRCHYCWKNSTFLLDLFAWREIPEIEARFTGEWNEKEETLKLALATGAPGGEILSGQADAHIRRVPDECEQPFLDYVASAGCGFFAHALHGYDSLDDGELRLTVLRPVIYAEHTPNPPHGDEGYADVGFQERKFWIFSDLPDSAFTPEMLDAAARRRLWCGEHLEITAAADGSNFHWEEWEISPEFLRLNAQKLNGDGSVEFHLLNPAERSVQAVIRRNGSPVMECMLRSNELRILHWNTEEKQQ